VVDELQRIDHERTQLDLTVARAAIRTCLTDLKNRPETPQKINVYKVQEVVQSGRGHRAFLALHPSGARRLLKLFELDPVEQPREFILREYTAVHLAASKGASPDVDPYFYWNDDRYLALPFWLPEGTALRTAAAPALLDNPAYALELAAACFRQISVLHKTGLVHRRLDRESIYFRRVAAEPSVQFFNLMFAHIDHRQTIANELDEMEKDNPYLSPECRIGYGLGGPESDIYGLALSLCGHLSDVDPTREEAECGTEDWVETALRARFGSWPVEIADSFIDLLRECVSSEPRRRPTSGEVQNVLKRLHEAWEALRREKDTTVRIFGNGQYRLLRVLGEGATAVTYLVEDTFYGGEFVLKRIKNLTAVQRYAKAEFNALKDLTHPHLPRVYDVRPPQDDFHLKLEYIPGSELTHCLEHFRHRPDRLIHLAEALLSALSYLEEHGIAHRDISPKNIIVPDQDQVRICLIDFGLAKVRQDMRQSAVGTPLYRDPEVDRSGWSNTSDLYSVAVVLHEALTGRLPFVYEDGVPAKNVRGEMQKEEEGQCGSELLACLRRAAGLEGQRYPSASAFLRALQEAAASPESTVSLIGQEVQLDWVRQLRGLYRNSASGNADNRGLDSDFARDTYVPTLLDMELLPDIVKGAKRLVFLTGNPGDGKTAFLEKIRDRLKELSASVVSEDRYGWVLEIESRQYEAIYDASESRQDRSSEEILSQAFSAFRGSDEPDFEHLPLLLIAINDGRLHEFFRAHRSDYGWLAGQIDRRVFGDGAADSRIALVDLKRRSLVQLPDEPASLFSRMLAVLLQEGRWTGCNECTARGECPIKFNADSLRNHDIEQRLERLFLVQHWRRVRRATIRDVRSALAYCITGNLACDDVHAVRRSGVRDQEWPLRSYFHAAFNAGGENDEMLHDLAAMDPAQRANPRLDRFLHFHRSAEKWRAVLNYLEPVAGRASMEDGISPEFFGSQWHGAVKRRLYFEVDDVRSQNDRWELPPHAQLLPYLYLDDFQRALTGEWPLSEVQDRLLAGISQSEGITRYAAGGKLSLTLSRNQEQELTVIKQFEPTKFRCRVVVQPNAYVESIPDALELYHISGDPRLQVTLDLFEILSRLAEGYTPDTQEFEPFLIELREFKSRLLRTGVKEALLLEGRSRMHRVVMENNTITLREAQ
jgi:serine/threonine protein kinase